MARIEPRWNSTTLADADIMIEAVFERMDVKQDLFGKFDALCQAGRHPGHQHVARSTSTRSPRATNRPHYVIGTALLLARPT